MKQKTVFSLFLVIALFFVSTSLIHGQNDCKVLLPRIAESYQGGCKNGYAHGKGIANGTDKYEGKFKFGYPDGRGTYYWSTGEYYVGAWKEGKRSGKGKLHFKMNGTDSVRYGIWENDQFVKKIPIKPYKVTRSNSVVRYTFRKIGEGNQVLISIMQNGAVTKVYKQMSVVNSSGFSYNDGYKFGFQNINFPFECELNYIMPTTLHTGNYEVDFNFIINQPGKWEVIIYN